MKNYGIFIIWYRGYDIRYYPDDKMLEIMLDTEVVFSYEPALIPFSMVNDIIELCKKHIDKIEDLKHRKQEEFNNLNALMANELIKITES